MRVLMALRELNFDVGVSLDVQTLTGWPRQDGAVTLIRLDPCRVVSHENATTEAQRKAALSL
jgi:hypothetical protein